ncbi:type IV pilus twitching motility protein PilT [Deinococcus peraridilitoris]|uniref:Pilus retraction protein PilT n=1 Tax=Deinococcus peraridilitoris (strain DSM 19664 / LMG 22246 / CIP 109416 / KR-200) TaxID=937777 RepID=K9ZVP3_DEIPD|nr:PilT/PilU family type 4a pilus ATPase [Deinococcus peraridilitoris]AFZ65683.1 pilus retraction protein PilT [Deinococcus peraridilitoris DSM 19664]
MASFDDLLTYFVNIKASDIHLRAGAPPMGRINGEIKRIGSKMLSPADLEKMCRAIMKRPGMFEEFAARREADFAYGLPEVARFRVNAMYQRDSIALIMRIQEHRPNLPTFEDLGLPSGIFGELSSKERGLILVTGPTGSGKTTTLASMLDHINATSASTVVTIEDPIEILHKDKQATFYQREIGTDTLDFKLALRAAMRQDPDVILIGEMRDKETVEAALSAAQTGHLVFSTLHTLDAPRTVTRILDFFAPHERDQIRKGLSESLVGVISQRLLPRKGGGRVLGLELMIGTATVRDCIADEDKFANLKEAIQDGFEQYGMHTFDQHLARLVKEDAMTPEDAIQAATTPTDLKMMLMRNAVY